MKGQSTESLSNFPKPEMNRDLRWSVNWLGEVQGWRRGRWSGAGLFQIFSGHQLCVSKGKGSHWLYTQGHGQISGRSFPCINQLNNANNTKRYTNQSWPKCAFKMNSTTCSQFCVCVCVCVCVCIPSTSSVLKNKQGRALRGLFWSRSESVESESQRGSVVSDSLRPRGLYSPWNSPGQNTGVGSLSLLQGIFPT